MAGRAFLRDCLAGLPLFNWGRSKRAITLPLEKRKKFRVRIKGTERCQSFSCLMTRLAPLSPRRGAGGEVTRERPQHSSTLSASSGRIATLHSLCQPRPKTYSAANRTSTCESKLSPSSSDALPWQMPRHRKFRLLKTTTASPGGTAEKWECRSRTTSRPK